MPAGAALFRNGIRFLTGAALIGLAASGHAARADGKADLKIGRIAIFSSGVAYFEREASVEGDATAELQFRTEQINDILKSLVVRDMDGGAVSLVSYASRDPVEKALRSFGVDITGKPTLAQLLDQLRGEPIEITGERALKGVILGVEKRQIIIPPDTKIEADVLNILTEAGIQQVQLSQISGLKLTNEKVDGELRKALMTLAASHDADKKSVAIEFEGKGARRVRAAYLLEAPIWKTSYRLVLNKDKKPFLQGWATVENATEEDWKDVRLSLISGRPISFRMDLYTPLYVPRPLEQLELYASLRPPTYEGDAEAEKKLAAKAPGRPAPATAARAFDDKAEDAAAMRRMSVAGGARGGRGGGASPEAWEQNQADGDGAIDLESSGIHSLADAQQAGELFEYAISTPVSIGRQHSAMLPIVNEEVEAEKVSIYNPATHAKHPLNGLQLKNATKLNLMQGPITVFDSAAYAGDAKLPDMRPDEKRLIAYALDLGTEVTVDQKSHPETVQSVWIKKGVLWSKRKSIDERVYNIKNKDADERKVLIEQAYSNDWQLIEPKEPSERTPALMRFEVKAAGQKTTPQTVRFERVWDQYVQIGGVANDGIEWFLRNVKISDKVKQALERVIALRAELDAASRAKAAAEQVMAELEKDQGRIRENLKTLDKASDSYRRQMTKFDELDAKIETQRTAVVAARENEEKKRAELEAYLLSIDAE
ncbi:MAG: hypothetical protein JNG88_00225 [Phycisphaerales bacterium]|nr:hypothetical protein [Phycisphaerales bacterium]